RERTNLLAVTQVLTRLRFPNPDLLAILGGQKVMIESPLIQEMVADQMREAILDELNERFQSVPVSLNNLLRAVTKQKELRALLRQATRVPSLDAFREAVLSLQP